MVQQTAIFKELISIRKQQRTNQQFMCKYLNINKSTMSAYERGHRMIPFHLLIKYAKVLGYDLLLIKTIQK
jgi:transcriptional regulator with XRE-family HTH domain